MIQKFRSSLSRDISFNETEAFLKISSALRFRTYSFVENWCERSTRFSILQFQHTSLRSTRFSSLRSKLQALDQDAFHFYASQLQALDHNTFHFYASQLQVLDQHVFNYTLPNYKSQNQQAVKSLLSVANHAWDIPKIVFRTQKKLVSQCRKWRKPAKKVFS